MRRRSVRLLIAGVFLLVLILTASIRFGFPPLSPFLAFVTGQGAVPAEGVSSEGMRQLIAQMEKNAQDVSFYEVSSDARPVIRDERVTIAGVAMSDQLRIATIGIHTKLESLADTNAVVAYLCDESGASVDAVIEKSAEADMTVYSLGGFAQGTVPAYAAVGWLDAEGRVMEAHLYRLTLRP